MRPLWLAALVGVAIGAAILAPSISNNLEARSSDSWPPSIPRTVSEERISPERVNPNEPRGHSDSNTQGASRDIVVRLNQNVIKGETTSLCIRDASIRHIVHRAKDLWNNALRTSLGFNVFEISTDSQCAGKDIEVVQRGDLANSGNARCEHEFNPATGKGAWGCYFTRPNDNPPRQCFSTSDESAELGPVHIEA